MNLQSIVISQLSAIFVVSYSSQCKRDHILYWYLDYRSIPPKFHCRNNCLQQCHRRVRNLKTVKKNSRNEKFQFHGIFFWVLKQIFICIFTFFQDHNNIAMAEPSTSDAVVQEPTKKSQDYEDLFPKLPGAAPTSISGNNKSH